MWRAIGGIVLGLVAWALVVTLLNFGLRAAMPGYPAAEATLVFTLEMKSGRLVEAALASLAAGASTASIAPEKRWAPWVVGLILLAAFVPEHMRLWPRFPIWYHLTFLLTLAPLVALGGKLAEALKAKGTKPVTTS
jgi:CDP-diglyceride synthetase